MAIFNTIVQGGGSPAPSGKYQLLQRITDDSNNEIGTVAGFFTDSNNTEYAVVCLDARYRPSSTLQMAAPIEYTTLPKLAGALGYGDSNTATYNCSHMLSETPGVSGLTTIRAISFTIESNTYQAQVPNFPELLIIIGKSVALNSADTSLSQYSSLALPEGTFNISYQSSTQRSTSGSWIIQNDGFTSSGSRSNYYWNIPILELPNA